MAALLGCPDPTTTLAVTCSEDAMTEASPINYVSVDDPPIYLGYGDLDSLVPPSTNGLRWRLGTRSWEGPVRPPSTRSRTRDTTSTSTE